MKTDQQKEHKALLAFIIIIFICLLLSIAYIIAGIQAINAGANSEQTKDFLIKHLPWEWHEILKLTWERNNIAKIERFENDGSFIEKIEYSYTNYRAHMLGFFWDFNPFTEMDFLDGINEAALFYTNACGTLSFNLPSKAIFFNSKKGKATRTYKYETDHSGYPISVTINGEGYDSDFYGYPINMAITWE